MARQCKRCGRNRSAAEMVLKRGRIYDICNRCAKAKPITLRFCQCGVCGREFPMVGARKMTLCNPCRDAGKQVRYKRVTALAPRVHRKKHELLSKGLKWSCGGGGKTERRCLMCDRLFLSEGRGNRRCPLCVQRVANSDEYWEF